MKPLRPEDVHSRNKNKRSLIECAVEQPLVIQKRMKVEPEAYQPLHDFRETSGARAVGGNVLAKKKSLLGVLSDGCGYKKQKLI